MSELFGQYNVPEAKTMLNLGCGQPAQYYLADALKQLTLTIPENELDVLQYGFKSGFKSYRDSIISFIKSNCTSDETIYGSNPYSSDEVYMTNGVSQAVFMLGSLFKSGYLSIKNNTPIKKIYVEESTYFIMIKNFIDLGYEIDTFDPLNLEELFYKLIQDDKNNIHSMIYIIPFCHNPTGRSLNELQIVNFVTMMKQFNSVIISDETYQFLHFKEKHNLTLAKYNNKNVIAVNTFSKVFAPAIRLGWIMTENQEWIQKLDDSGFMDSGGGLNPIVGLIMRNIINNNDCTIFNELITRFKLDLEKKYNFITSELKKYPEYFEFEEADGGYFIFVKSLKIEAENLRQIANKIGINFHIGNKFSINKTHNNYFRLSVSFYSFEDIESYFGKRLYNLVHEINKLCYIPEQHIFILGGKGRLGTLIAKELNIQNETYELISRDDINKMKNSVDLNEEVDNIHSLNMSDNAIIIDVSTAPATNILLEYLIKFEKFPKIIIGTTGLIDKNLLSNYAKHNTIIKCSNFGIGIRNIVSSLESFDSEYFNTEIIEKHHIYKLDKPSGTALTLKNALTKSKFNDTSIESIREGEIVGYHEIIMSNPYESIRIIHEAKDRSLFAKGCCNILNKVKNNEYNIGLYEL